MKTKLLFIVSVLPVLLGTAFRAKSQDCVTPSCATDTINISTGYTPSGMLNPLSVEGNWVLTSVPTNVYVTPGAAWVITPSGSWSTYTNARWLSPITNAN